MGESVSVSVVVPAYRVGRFIGRCLKSILRQSYSGIEVIVVYVPSADSTLDVLGQYADKIELIKVRRKTSPAIARNIGLACAKGEYIAFCDGDDFFAPDKIERQVNMLNVDSNTGLIYTDYTLVDDLGRELKHVRVPDWNKKRWLSRQFAISISSVLVRREILDDIAVNGRYFDEMLLACEDLDLLIRLSEVTDFKRVPSFLTYYTLHEGQLSKDMMKTIIMGNKVLIKHGLYTKIIPQSAFELSKMALTRILKNPLIGFGFFSNDDRKNAN